MYLQSHSVLCCSFSNRISCCNFHQWLLSIFFVPFSPSTFGLFSLHISLWWYVYHTRTEFFDISCVQVQQHAYNTLILLNRWAIFIHIGRTQSSTSRKHKRLSIDHPDVLNVRHSLYSYRSNASIPWLKYQFLHIPVVWLYNSGWKCVIFTWNWMKPSGKYYAHSWSHFA